MLVVEVPELATSNKERLNNEINLKESEGNQNRLRAILDASKDTIVVLGDFEQNNFMSARLIVRLASLFGKSCFYAY